MSYSKLSDMMKEHLPTLHNTRCEPLGYLRAKGFMVEGCFYDFLAEKLTNEPELTTVIIADHEPRFSWGDVEYDHSVNLSLTETMGQLLWLLGSYGTCNNKDLLDLVIKWEKELGYD